MDIIFHDLCLIENVAVLLLVKREDFNEVEKIGIAFMFEIKNK